MSSSLPQLFFTIRKLILQTNDIKDRDILTNQIVVYTRFTYLKPYQNILPVVTVTCTYVDSITMKTMVVHQCNNLSSRGYVPHATKPQNRFRLSKMSLMRHF